MTLLEMKKKVLGLIEELDADSEFLTEDPDIQTKINDVTNQILYELARMKKIPRLVELSVTEGQLVDFEAIGAAAGNEIYQVAVFGGVDNLPKAGGTMYKILESGVAEIECYVYPERITDTTKDSYEFELSADALEIMPYGIAADLLKSDVSTEYGSVYAQRYETMLQRLDPRYQMGSITIEGGVSI